MWEYFKFELKQFFTNKKNLSIYFLLAFATIFYALKVAPVYDPIEKVDNDEISARYLTRQEFIESVENRNFEEIHPVTVNAYYMFGEINPLDKARLDALNSKDLQKYAELTSEWYFKTNYITYYHENIPYNDRYYVKDRQFADQEGFYNYLEQHVRYKAYAEADYELSTNLFEQRTALQTLERLLKGPLPIILIICALLLSVDLVTKDRLHPSILKGFPITDWKKLLVKMALALIGSLTLFVPLFVGFIIIGIQSGFGNFHLPSPVYASDLQWTQDGKFEMMTLGAFLYQSFSLLFAWFFVVITIVLLSSVLFRQEMVNLAIGLLLVFGERFYTSRGVGYFWDIEKYPTSYIQVGRCVENRFDFERWGKGPPCFSENDDGKGKLFYAG